MAHQLVSEIFYEEGFTELIYACTSPEEAVEIHEKASNLGYTCLPKPHTILNQCSMFVRVMILEEQDKVILKLAL